MWNLWHNVYFIEILAHSFSPKTNQHFALALSYRLMGTAIPRRKNKPITQNWTSQHPFLEQARCQCKQSKHTDDVGVVDLFYACIFVTMLVASISKHGLHVVFTLVKDSATCFRSKRVLFICVYVTRTYYVVTLWWFWIHRRCHWIKITICHIHQCGESTRAYTYLKRLTIHLYWYHSAQICQNQTTPWIPWGTTTWTYAPQIPEPYAFTIDPLNFEAERIQETQVMDTSRK